MKKFLTIITTGILVLYPFAVYVGLNYLPPSTLAAALLLLLGLRIVLLKNNLKKMPWLLPASILGVFSLTVSLFMDTTAGFKLYPLAVNLAMLLVFGFSYFKPPSVIETFARITEKNLTEPAVKYTEKVTLVWCAFFIINGAISLYTALYTNLDTWMIYNGFIAYIMMALLMAIEYAVRLKVKKQHSQQAKINNGSAK